MKKSSKTKKRKPLKKLIQKIKLFLCSISRRLGLEELKQLRWQNFLLLIGAGCVNAVGVTMFLAPVNLYDSGISGTSMLLWQATPPEYTLSLFLLIPVVPVPASGSVSETEKR